MARFDRVILPGEEGQIVASMDTTKYRGVLTKAVRITTNDPLKQQTNLSMRADIKMWMDVLPSWNVNLTGDKGKELKKTMFLKSREPGDVPDIGSVTSSSPWVTGRIEKVTPGSTDAVKGDLRLIVTLSPEAPVGPVRGNLVVSGSGPNPRSLELAINGRVHGPIAIFPTAVNLFAQPSSGRPDRLTGTITLQARPHQPTFELREIQGDDERLEIEAIPDPENRRHRIAVRWTAKEAKGDFSGSIRIQTTSPDMPEILVPYRVRIL